MEAGSEKVPVGAPLATIVHSEEDIAFFQHAQEARGEARELLGPFRANEAVVWLLAWCSSLVPVDWSYHASPGRSTECTLSVELWNVHDVGRVCASTLRTAVRSPSKGSLQVPHLATSKKLPSVSKLVSVLPTY